MAEGKGRASSGGLYMMASKMDAKLKGKGLKKGTAAWDKAFAAEKRGIMNVGRDKLTKAGYKGEGGRVNAELRDGTGRARGMKKAAEKASVRADKVGKPAKKYGPAYKKPASKWAGGNPFK